MTTLHEPKPQVKSNSLVATQEMFAVVSKVVVLRNLPFFNAGKPV